MGVTASTSKSGSNKEMIPPWVYTVKIPPDCGGDKLCACSDGMNLVGPNTVVRSRKGVFDTDGARWSRGFTSGKHTFEVVYPMAHRGSEAAVGVGTEEAPLHAKGRVVLAGNNKFSWGICLRTRRAFHKNAIVKKYPATQDYLPDKFYMYLDADSGTLQFGSDLEYYGTALTNIPRQQPLYPMVAACIQGATITIAYRGKGNTDCLVPGVATVVVPGPQPVQVVTPGAPGPHSVAVVQAPQLYPQYQQQDQKMYPPPDQQHQPMPYYPSGPPPYSEAPPDQKAGPPPPSDSGSAPGPASNAVAAGDASASTNTEAAAASAPTE